VRRAPFLRLGTIAPRNVPAAAGERTKRIKLGTGVVSLPITPFSRAAHGAARPHTGGARSSARPGALASDAHTLGIDPRRQRDRQDEAIAVIRRTVQRRARHRQADWSR